MGHWYTQDGQACHFQPDGKDTTLRHARKQNLVPSVTEILNILAKPGLDQWKENQLLDAAWSIRDEPWHSVDFWKADVKSLAHERSTMARDRGTEIHNAIEEWIKTKKVSNSELYNYVQEVAIAIGEKFSVKLSDLTAEKTFAHPLGYGGMVDAIGENLILDWKTKDKEFDDKTKLAYDEHGVQLAAYRKGLGLEGAVCANVYISPSAKVRVHVWDEDRLQRLWLRFKLCLDLWKDMKDYMYED